MSTVPKPIEWAPSKPGRTELEHWVLPVYGMQELGDGWAVVKQYQWSQYEPSLVMVVDSRDAAIGFVKLLRGE